MTPWHEDDTLWTVLEPFLFSAERLAAAPAEAEAVVERLGLQPGARVLDLCCGPGRHAVALARLGFRVTGVDRNAAYLARAGETAGRAGVELELVEQDMRRFVRPGAFDAVINMFTSFGYFEDEVDNRLVADNMARCLAPGGAVLIDTVGKEVLARDWQPRSWSEAGGVLLLEERATRQGWQLMEARWTVLSKGQRHELTLRHRIYSGGELEAILRGAGLAEVALYGNLQGAPYDQRAQRLVAVARA